MQKNNAYLKKKLNIPNFEFEKLQNKIQELNNQTGKLPEIVFEATGIYFRQLERFMQDNQYTYCLLNPMEAKLQCDSLWIHKTD